MCRRLHLRFPAGMLVMLLALLLASCGTRAPHYDYRQLAKSAVRLDMDIDAKDNHRLYNEVADWTPTVEQQLLRGGLRLARILNSLFDPSMKQNAPYVPVQ